MRKASLLFTLVLIFTLLLAACSSGGEQEGAENGTPGASETGTQEAIPGTGASTDVTTPTVGMDTTGTVSATGEATQDMTATVEPTGAGTAGEATSTFTTTPTSTSGSSGTTGGTTPTAKANGQAGANAGVIGIPKTGSNGLVGLASMMNWRVVGADGTEIGTVSDYVLNMCEAHILYLVVDPAASTASSGNASGGQQILIPFEAVLGELNPGSKVDVQQGVFTLKQNASDLSGVPGVDIATADMQNPNWAQDVNMYWSANYRISLTAGCNVPASGNQGGGAGQQATTMPSIGRDATATPTAGGSTSGGNGSGSLTATATQAAGAGAAVTVTPTVQGTPDKGSTSRQTIYKIALASKVLAANLQEGNGRQLGAVQDIAIVPQSGRTQFIVVKLGEAGQSAGAAANRLVALPPGAVNISYENSADQPVLVLLVDTATLQNAPAFDAATKTTDESWFNFWNQYIPMTREQLP